MPEIWKRIRQVKTTIMNLRFWESDEGSKDVVEKAQETKHSTKSHEICTSSIYIYGVTF